MNNKLHKAQVVQNFRKNFLPIINSADQKIIRAEWLKFIEDLKNNGQISNLQYNSWMTVY